MNLINEITNLLKNITKIKSILVAVSTGVANISSKNFEYQGLFLEIEKSVKKLNESGFNFVHENIFHTLEDWYGHYSLEFKSYDERKQYVRSIYQSLENTLKTYRDTRSIIEEPLAEKNLKIELNSEEKINKIESFTDNLTQEKTDKNSLPQDSSDKNNVSQEGEDKKNEKKGKRKLTRLEIAGIIGGFIGLAFIILGAIFGDNLLDRINQYRQSKEPLQFEYQFEGVLDPENPVYEITQWMYSEENFNKFFNYFYFNIKSLNTSQKNNSTANIYINEEKLPTTWDNFSKEYPIEMSSGKIFKYADFEIEKLSINDIFDSLNEDRVKSLNLTIRQNANGIISKKIITIKNTPWIHITQIEDSTINAGGKIHVNVNVKNLGDPAKFYIRYILYDLNKPLAENETLTEKPYWSFDDIGWWGDKSWPVIGKETMEIEGEISTNSEGYKDFELPTDIPPESLQMNGYQNFEFENKQIYLLEVRAGKKLPYLKFKESDWLNSEYSWVASDTPTYFTLICLEKQ